MHGRTCLLQHQNHTKCTDSPLGRSVGWQAPPRSNKLTKQHGKSVKKRPWACPISTPCTYIGVVQHTNDTGSTSTQHTPSQQGTARGLSLCPTLRSLRGKSEGRARAAMRPGCRTNSSTSQPQPRWAVSTCTCICTTATFLPSLAASSVQFMRHSNSRNPRQQLRQHGGAHLPTTNRQHNQHCCTAHWSTPPQQQPSQHLFRPRQAMQPQPRKQQQQLEHKSSSSNSATKAAAATT